MTEPTQAPVDGVDFAPRGGGSPSGVGVSILRRLLAFSGPGYVVAVGYMDPGNWATDLGGGSAFGYGLLSVIVASSLAAIVLQVLSLRLGVATGQNLAEACRDRYGPRVRIAMWALCEVAIVACDLAELIGTAIALQLLFHLPLIIGVVLTAFDTLLLLALNRMGVRALEAVIIALIGVVSACMLVELALAKPVLAQLVGGLAPSVRTLSQPGALYMAVGIMGATVMPHNLYLHSAIVQSRPFARTPKGRREAVAFNTLDTVGALSLAMLVNAAILIVAAAVFHARGHTGVAEIQDAYRLLTPLLGAGLAAPAFAIALLAAGQNSTVTATMAGQVVMEGFLRLRISPYLRRILTRLTAVVPAIAVVAAWGETGAGRLLVFSQVLLSLQLPFAVVPLIRFTSERSRMGDFASPRWLSASAWAIAAAIVAMNGFLIVQVLLGRS